VTAGSRARARRRCAEADITQKGVSAEQAMEQADTRIKTIFERFPIA
jgi:hypothetical protein